MRRKSEAIYRGPIAFSPTIPLRERIVSEGMAIETLKQIR